VGVAHGQHADTDPVAALDAWLSARGSTAGHLFTSLRPGIATLEPISGNAVTRIVKDRAGFAGLAAERITAHSLRAGHATNAALAGVSVDRIAAQVAAGGRRQRLLERSSAPLSWDCDPGR